MPKGLLAGRNGGKTPKGAKAYLSHPWKNGHKAGLYTKEATEEDYQKKIDASLKNLGLDAIDIYHHHGASVRESVHYEPVMKALEKAEKAGKIRFKLFVIEGRDQKECRYMIHEYLEHTGNLQIKIEEGRFQLKDPYHGGMDFYWKGRYIWGALDLADETLRSRVLKLFAEGLEKEK